MCALLVSVSLSSALDYSTKPYECFDGKFKTEPQLAMCCMPLPPNWEAGRHQHRRFATTLGGEVASQVPGGIVADPGRLRAKMSSARKCRAEPQAALLTVHWRMQSVMFYSAFSFSCI